MNHTTFRHGRVFEGISLQHQMDDATLKTTLAQAWLTYEGNLVNYSVR